MVEELAAMWANIYDESRKKEMAEIEEAEGQGGKGSRENVEGEKGCGENMEGAGKDDDEKERSGYKRFVILGILRSVSEEITKAKKDINQLIEMVEGSHDDTTLSSKMDVKLVLKGQMKDLEMEAESIMFPGEWISVAISKIVQQSEKKKFCSLNAVLKLLLFKLIPYDVSCPALMRVEGVPFDKGVGKDTRIVVKS